MRNLHSVIRGIQAMYSPFDLLHLWKIELGKFGFWLEYWTPSWHRGRGPYVSASVGWLHITRGF